MILRILLPFFLISQMLFAQHDHHAPAVQPDSGKVKADSTLMGSAFSPNLPMNRDGSGTSWQPDESPMRMHLMMKGNTHLMVHGTFFLRYTSQDITGESKRGGDQVDAPNMFMFMLSQKLNDKNLVSFMSMFSLDPLTVGNGGYPLLFQTGESYKGVPLVDRQHPHDLISGLALNYTHSFTKHLDINTYFGYPGEPALGPVVFMHRISAMNNPDAPLAHHWQDASHVTFGTGTLGIRYKTIKAEGSIFTGREPDENRYDFDRPRFDSYSYRLSSNPNKNLSLQFSHAFIKSPEALFPDEDIFRTTASVIHTVKLKQENFISSSLVWGVNTSEGRDLGSVLLESNLQLKHCAIYARYEFVQKDVHELQLLEFDEDLTFNIQAFTLGLNKIVSKNKAADISIGAQGTIHFTDKYLTAIYGNNPLSAQAYLKISPPKAHVHRH